jgi:acetyltransferase-like isoleucine patch superfamily enzyme
MVDKNVKIGKGTKIFDPNLVNLFQCQIGNNSFVGPFVEITRGVTVGNDCKIESHSFICTGVKIGNNVFIGHGVMFTNDLYPRTDRHVVYPKTTVKMGASLGTNCVVLGGLTIGKNAIIGAGAVVTKNVPDYTIVAGNPAKVLKSFKNLTKLKSYIQSKQKSSS